ncbi:MAG: 2-oxoacid:acceptor oxidoreductase family protein [Clostridiales Family XIII bacterium]|jgi:2-oxoglutarate ferredoxin oxidoreductase subunit gamma|nr:2-oxoacid:acceptor oxidoreductase family protein [Clostridiales Family XIII bacterium]
MKEIIFAGFGGQGVLTGGLILSFMAAEKDLETTWMPAYGATMRGGKANCVVKMGEVGGERIGNPLMGHADALIAMNEPSLDYLGKTKKGAVVIVNSHGVDENYEYPSDKKVYKVDSVELAEKVSNEQGQNLVMLGAMMKVTELYPKDEAIDLMCKFFASKGKEKYNEKNIAAFLAGYDAV